MLLVIKSKTKQRLTLGTPLGILRPFETISVELPIAEIERLGPFLATYEQNGLIEYETGNAEGEDDRVEAVVRQEIFELLPGTSLSQPARNESGVLIPRGAAVVPSGYSSIDDILLIQLADKDDPARRPAIGLALENIPNGVVGDILEFGRLIDIDTSMFNLTDQLVLGNNGALIRPPPDTDPFTGEVQYIGSVARVDPIEGEIILGIGGTEVVTADEVFSVPQSIRRGYQEGGAITRLGGLQVQVAAGVGFLTSNPSPRTLTRVRWVAQLVNLPANDVSNIYINSAGLVQLSTSLPNLDQNLILGTARTSATDVVFLSVHRTPVTAKNARDDEYSREVVGPITVSGNTVTVNGLNPLGLDIDGGAYYITNERRTAPTATGITFTYWYRDGSGGYSFVTSQTDVDPDLYDDGSGTLQPVPVGEYKKDVLYITFTTMGTTEYHMIYGQETFATQIAAEEGNNPIPSSSLQQFSLRVAGIVLTEGASAITSVVDARPFLGQLASGLTSVANHALLAGLGGDDHPQYFLVDGGRAMTGALDLGNNPIANPGLIDGVDITSHAARHLPTGADPLATGSPAPVGTSNQIGIANSFSRSDHVHSHGNQTVGTLHAVATTLVPGFMSDTDKTKLDGVADGATNTPLTSDPPVNTTRATAVVGISTEAARADHKHDINTATAVTIGATNEEGISTSLSRADHVHAHGTQLGGTLHSLATDSTAGFMSAADKDKLNGIEDDATNTPLTSTPPVDTTRDSAVVGVSAEAARADHKHDISTATATGAISIGASASEGSSTSLARADHIHALATPAAPATVGTSNSAGSSATPARADHVHAHGDQGGGTLHAESTTLVSGFMSSTDKTKLDGVEAGATNTPLASTAPANVTKSAAVIGVSTTVARSDHKHDITTGTAVSIGSANTEGVSATLSRSDHVHAHDNQAGGTLHAAATVSVAGFMSAADKTKLDGVATGATNTPLTATAPVNVTKAAAAVGVSTQAARSDHKHDITTAAPSAVGTANSEGSSTSLARADHVHSHGNQTVGTLHAAATPSVAGFMSAADKTKLDSLASVQQVEGTAQLTTTSATFVALTGMTITPGAGNWLVMFSGDFISGGTSGVTISLFVNGVQVAATSRQYEGAAHNGKRTPMSFQYYVSGLAGGQAVDVRWLSGAGTAECFGRTLTVLRTT